MNVTIPEEVVQWQDDTRAQLRLDPDKTYALFASCAADLWLWFAPFKENPDTVMNEAGVDRPTASGSVPYPGGFIGHVRGCQLLAVQIGIDFNAPFNSAAAATWGHAAQLRVVEMPNGSTEDTGMGVYTFVPLDT